MKQESAKKVTVLKKTEKVVPEGCGVIVGRFQLHKLHEAHIDLIETVRSRHRKVIIFLGVSKHIGSKRNPLDFIARKQMIEEKFKDVVIVALPDNRSDKVWSSQLDERVREVCPTGTVTLYGGRDSFMGHYCGAFNNLVELEQKVYVSATEVRKEVSDAVKGDPMFRAGVIWARANRHDQAYPTVDVAVMKTNSRELLLARKPGEERLRFLGGHVNPTDYNYEAAARREVMEEANVEISDPVYLGSLKVDDWRYRSEPDKIITGFYLAEYVAGAIEPKDDVCELRWVKLDDVEPAKDVVPEHQPLLEFLRLALHRK